MSLKRHIVTALLCPLILCSQPPAPAGDDTGTIKVDVNVVNLLFSVKNKQNGFVGNLTKDNFTIFEDGKQQTVKNFTRETDLPLTMGLLVDVSKSQENLIDTEQRAAVQFFEKVLKAKDQAFLISFGQDSELLQDYTSSSRLLRDGLSKLRVDAPAAAVMRGPIGNPGPVPTMNSMRGTVLYEAVYLAANEKLKGEVGRKAIIIITDGMDEGSRIKINEAIESAQRADAIIYGIYYVDRGMYGFGGASDSYLKRMAEETGGRVFHIDRKLTLNEAFAQLQEELRSQYSVSYTPTNTKADGTFRKLEIKTDQKEYKVQARRGYYAPKE